MCKTVFFCLSARTSKKSFKNDLREPPRENRPTTGPRRAKRAPRRSQEPSIQFSNCPFLAQSALLRPTWRPRRPRRSPEARLGLPTTRNWTPGGVEFDPRGLLFWTRGRRFLQPPATHFRTQVGLYCAYNMFILCQHVS